MFQVKKNFRKALVTVFMLMVFCVSAVMSISAAEDADKAHKLTYMVDGSVWKEQEYKEGDKVEVPKAPEKENFIFTEWKDLPDTMPAADVTVTGVYNFDGALVTDLDQVYECDLVVSEEIAVTMYLRINKEGNFVFSRSTDFSQAEKGAGKVYRKSEKADITGGEYAVDISWSPMQGMFEPVLNIDAENMTFKLYNASEPETGKGNGTIAYADGVYSLNFTDGNTTTFTFENGVITFTSKLWYGSASFERKDDNDEFISYQAELTSEAEGQADTTDASAEDGSIAPGTYCLVYYVVNNENVALGENVTTFEVEENGNLQITSPFWFGATTPQFVADDGTVTYPEFIISQKAIEKDIDASVIVSKEEKEEEKNAENQANESGDSTGFKTGTYGGSYTTTAMGSSLTYAITITFNADGSYHYTVKFNMMGKTYTESESGTYKVNGSSLTLSSGKGGTMSGSVSGNSVSITRKVSSYSFSAATITLTYGVTPGVTASNAKPGNTEDTKESDKQTESSKETEDNNKAPVTGDGGITGGEYQVDISWSPMAGMMSPVLNIDAQKMTFRVYNASKPGEDKGNGTVTYSNGVYTLHYSTGVTATFTYKDKNITFTSPLYYGKASFNQTDDKGAFVPYSAKLGKNQTSDQPSTPSTEPSTEPVTEPTTEPVTEAPTEAPAKFQTGTYGGTYTSSTAMGTTDYIYTLTFNEDGTYKYQSNFEMKDVSYVQTETGTYVTDKDTFTLTSNGFSVTDPDGEEVFSGGAGQTMTGKITDGKAVSVTRKVSGMARADAELSLAYGVSGNGSGQEPEAPSESEDTSAKFQTGTYGGTYTSNTAMGTTNYAYTLIFNADKTYTYEVSFAVRGTAYVHKETGTYTTEENNFTLTNNGFNVTDPNGEIVMSGGAGQIMTGKITDSKAVSVTRKVCGMAMSEVELSLTYGLTPSVQTAGKSADKETVTEKVTETETEAVTEQMTEAAEEVTEVKTEPETEPESEITESATETKSEPETKATEVKSEPETKATEVKAEPETKATEAKKETESKAEEKKAEPETKATEAKKETESKAAEKKAEPETKTVEKEQ